MHISSASFAYPRLPGDVRALIARRLLESVPGAGVFVLSTCLRVEVAVAGDDVELKARLGDLFGAPPAEPEERTGEAAVEHLFRVAAGLESPIVGEVEVLTQFRQALADMRKAGGVDGRWSKLLESAVAAGRRAREAMGTSPHDTMAALAAQVTGPHAEVAVIGSGTMANAVVGALAGLPAPPRVAMVSREPDRAAFDGQIHPFSDLEEVLARYPAVVSATAASTRLIDEERLGGVLSARTTPLTLVDMAMPPDFAVSSRDGLVYVDIDDLARMARKRGVATGVDEQVAADAAAAHHDFVHTGSAGPIIAAMLAAGDAIVAETVERFAGRLSDPADREVLRQAAHTVARTILARPVTAVRASKDPAVVEALEAAFDDG